MILYFSATGNSEHVCKSIAARTGDRLIDIEECTREHRFEVTLAEGESLGIVTPVYFWVLPTIVEEFLDKLSVAASGGDHYTYLVVTFGSTPGSTASLANELMKRKGFPLKAFFTIQMPDTWTPIFNLSDPEKVRQQNEAADRQIEELVEKVADRREGDFTRRKIPRVLALPAKASYEQARRTSHLHVSSACIGCGLCAKGCPIQAIEMRDGRPVWVKEKCVMCLRCLHRCPAFAIQYGDKTQAHGQYVHP